MTDKKNPDALNEQELDQVTGGYANIEVSYIKSDPIKGEIEKNFSRTAQREKSGKYSKHIVAQAGDNEI